MMSVLTRVVLVWFVFAAFSTVIAGADDPCLDCHREQTPGVVSPWQGSAHARAGVGCADCHGSDHDLNHPEDGRRPLVPASTCAPCHEQATHDHQMSRHGLGFRAGQACTRNQPKTPETKAGCINCHGESMGAAAVETECARFLKQSPAMQRQGCISCHRVETQCDSCHTPHDTDLAIVRDPAVCAPCHMGPDHAQWEMWKTSKHGILFELKGPDVGPDCAACHMPGGTHDVSRGITMGLAGQAYPEEKRTTERENMLDICAQCHTRGFSQRSLDDGDTVQRESQAMLDEAAAIIQALDDEGLLLPGPKDRPPHPLVGNRVDLGPQMLYEDISAVEAEFFRMKKFHAVTAYKGVFHQNADYAHWYGNAPLKLSLATIRSQAEQLRKLGRLEQRIDLLATAGAVSTEQTGSLKSELRNLRDAYLKGEITEEDYEARKKELLDGAGL